MRCPNAKMVEKGEVSATLAVVTVRKEGTLMGTERLKEGVKTAKEKGKSHATAKHLPKSQVQRTKEPTEPLPPRLTEPHKDIDWNTRGPQLEKALRKIINADNSTIQQQAIMDARTLIKL